MTTTTETTKARNVKLQEGQVVNIRFANGTILSLSDAMLQAGRPVVASAENHSATPIEEPAAQPEQEQPVRRRRRKAKADKPEAAAPSKPAESNGKPSLAERTKGKRKKEERIDDCDFLGMAEYFTHDKNDGDCWKEVAIVWVGKANDGNKPALKLGYPRWDDELECYYVKGTFMVSQYHKKDGEFVLVDGEKQDNPKLRNVTIC